MQRKDIIAALWIVHSKLDGTGIKWMLLGSSSLMMQGADVEPHDIDILTDRQGARRIEAILKKYEVKPMIPGINGPFRANSFELRVKGVKVEVLHGLGERMNGRWVPVPMRGARFVEARGMKIRMFTLGHVLKVMMRSGRDKDAPKIPKVLAAIERNKKKRKISRSR
jgi:hypothetical protein